MRGCLIYHIKVLSFFFIYYYTIFKAYCMISVNPQCGNDIDHLYIYAACTKTLARNCTKWAEKSQKLKNYFALMNSTYANRKVKAYPKHLMFQ